MWCDKCHYGSETVKWKLDSDGKFLCRQCGTFGPVLNASPFARVKPSHGKRDKSPPKKFAFDQKGGRDSENPVAENQVAKPVELAQQAMAPVEPSGKSPEPSTKSPNDQPMASQGEKK